MEIEYSTDLNKLYGVVDTQVVWTPSEVKEMLQEAYREALKNADVRIGTHEEWATLMGSYMNQMMNDDDHEDYIIGKYLPRWEEEDISAKQECLLEEAWSYARSLRKAEKEDEY